MKIVLRLSRVVSVMLAVLSMCATAIAQTAWTELTRTSRKIDSGSVSRGNHAFYWETRVEPVLPAVGDLVGRAVSDTDGGAGIVHRILMDRERRAYFGYAVRIDAVNAKTYRLSFQPLAMTRALADRLLGGDAAGWTAIPAPTFPAPRTIGHGEVLEVPLLVNQAWGQRMVEYVTIHDPARSDGFAGLTQAPREFAHAPGTPRDFSVDDVELRLSRPTITARTPTAGGGSGRHTQVEGESTGSLLWIYVPNRGRYLLSLQPRAELGFRKAGDVRGSTMRFTDGAITYNLGSAARIAPGQAAFNLYVLFQKDWRPSYPHANLDVFQIGALERVEELLGK